MLLIVNSVVGVRIAFLHDVNVTTLFLGLQFADLFVSSFRSGLQLLLDKGQFWLRIYLFLVLVLNHRLNILAFQVIINRQSIVLFAFIFRTYISAIQPGYTIEGWLCLLTLLAQAHFHHILRSFWNIKCILLEEFKVEGLALDTALTLLSRVINAFLSSSFGREALLILNLDFLNRMVPCQLSSEEIRRKHWQWMLFALHLIFRCIISGGKIVIRAF